MIPLYLKLLIFFAILVIAYLVLRYYEMDPLVLVQEAISDIEWNITALILTLIFSFLLLAMIWKAPWWSKECVRTFCITGVPAKIVMSILLPFIGYPLAVRALNK